MNNIFCTLFNSQYLDKGLVLYNSMAEHMKVFKLYVFAFDERCYEILNKMNLKDMIVVSLSDFETPELLNVKKERTAAEYCWTCSSWTVRHVLEKFKEPICTYIDADMMFFSSPDIVFENMKKNNSSIIIVPHRFKTKKEEDKAEKRVGKYCVEFNTFKNDTNGLKALKWWSEKCLDWCFYARPGTTEWYGDQKYLNEFTRLFEGVYVCDHPGVGLAPWNNCLVCFDEDAEGNNVIEKATGKSYPLIIYHYESVSFMTDNVIHTASRMKDINLHKIVYDIYVDRIVNARRLLKRDFGFEFANKRRVVTNNFLMNLYHKYILPIRRIKHLYDLYKVEI